MGNFKAVLFDLDGTLLDTLQDIANSTNFALTGMGFPQHDTETYRYFVGLGREYLALCALPETNRNQETVDRLVAAINTEYARHWADNTRPYPGIPELLDSLAEKKILIAVLSNKADDFTKIAVSQMLKKWHFEQVLGAQSGVPKKPDPQTALQIAREIGVPPADFIYLGDSDVDMNTATSAGMYPAGAVWGFRTRDELKSGGAKVLLDNPLELLTLF